MSWTRMAAWQPISTSVAGLATPMGAASSGRAWRRLRCLAGSAVARICCSSYSITSRRSANTTLWFCRRLTTQCPFTSGMASCASEQSQRTTPRPLWRRGTRRARTRSPPPSTPRPRPRPKQPPPSAQNRPSQPARTNLSPTLRHSRLRGMRPSSLPRPRSRPNLKLPTSAQRAGWRARGCGGQIVLCIRSSKRSAPGQPRRTFLSRSMATSLTTGTL
mmetsp:Transcript_25805/g.65469  ORF Transcript_25805/g.65469 Transcript_25805/m.65469 type:complete len:218 (+) Transcript_25805:478-1131(+)